jgi:hypothetical protein
MRAFVVVLVTGCVFLCAWGYCQDREDDAADVSATSKGRLRVFFIGNSHTGCNRLIEVIRKLGIESKPWTEMVTAGHIVGGCTLERHWKDGKALSKMKKGKWDIVVLQENGQGPLAYPDKMRKYARLFDGQIKAIGAKTVFFMAAAYQDKPETTEILAKVHIGLG